MSRLLTCLPLLALCICPATADAAEVRGEAKAVMVEKGPAVDGTLNDPLWAKATVMTLGDPLSKKAAAQKTVARLLFSPTHLYLAVECAEPSKTIVAEAIERDGPAYAGDSIEFFVTGDPRASWYQFAVNAKGGVMDQTFKGSVRNIRSDKSWNSSIVAKTSFEPGKRWIATLSIPLAEISAYVGENQTWVMNVCRNRAGRDGGKNTHMSWSVLPSMDFHQHGDFGAVEGVNIPERPDGVTRKVAAVAPPPKFLKGQQRGDVIVYKTWDAVEIPNILGKGTNKGFKLPIKGSKGLKIAFLAGGKGEVTEAGLNLYDLRAKNNTSSWTDRWVDRRWRQIVYFVDDFHYNGTHDMISANTKFRSLSFHGNRSDDAKAVLRLRNLVVYRGEDRTPPAAPTGLKDEGASLSWEAAADNVAVARYVVSRKAADGTFVKVAERTGQHHVNTMGENSTYRVCAVDFENNVGPWSDTIVVKKSAIGMARPSQVEIDRDGYAANVRKIHAAGVGKVVRGRVFCYGDSHTNATVFPQTVQRALGQFQMRSVGHSGIRTGGALKNVDRHLERFNPEFCLILLGTNNGKSEGAIAGAMKDLLAIAARCVARGTVPMFLTIPPRGFGESCDGEKRYNAALIETCRKNGLPIAYSFDAQMAADRKGVLLGDGVHMKPGGVRLAAKAWQNTMAQVLFAILDRP